MKIIYFVTAILLIFFIDNSFAQSALDTATTWPQNEEGRNQTDKRVFTNVEEMPSFPGGNDSLNNFLIHNLKYPSDAQKNKISGKVYVSFVIDYLGKVTEVKIIRGIGGGCDEEAMRVVKSMPNWIPGKQNGKAVNVQYNLPVVFSL